MDKSRENFQLQKEQAPLDELGDNRIFRSDSKHLFSWTIELNREEQLVHSEIFPEKEGIPILGRRCSDYFP